MSFLGVPVGVLAPLLGTLAAVIAGLYLLRPRRPTLQVPFGALWTAVLGRQAADSPWRRLRRMRSLLLQLSLLASLGLALADPRVSGCGGGGARVVVIVDGSASMQGLRPLGPHQVALDRARARLLALEPGDQAAVVLASVPPRVLRPLGSPAAAIEALAQVPAPHGDADLEAALGLAATLIGVPAPEASLVLHTGEPRLEDLDASAVCDRMRCELSAVAAATPNIGITALSARRAPGDPSRVTLLVEVTNTGTSSRDVTLSVKAGRVSLYEELLTVSPGPPTRLHLRGLDAAGDELIATVTAEDPGDTGPRFDDEAHASLAPRAPLRVRFVSERPNLFVAAALLAMERPLRLETLTPTQARDDRERRARVGAPPPFELLIIDALDDRDPLPTEAVPSLIFDPFHVEARTFPVARGRRIIRPRITSRDALHPLLRGLVFKDVNLAEATALLPEEGDEVLLSHLQQPIAIVREVEGVPWAIFSFDPSRTDLPLRAAFPMLVARVLDMARTDDAGLATALTAGQPLVLPVEDARDDPTGPRDRVEFWSTDSTPRLQETALVVDGAVRVSISTPGTYELRMRRGDETPRALGRISVQGHGARATTAAVALEAEAATGAASPPADHDPLPRGRGPFAWILLAWCLVSVLEWRWFHQRRST